MILSNGHNLQGQGHTAHIVIILVFHTIYCLKPNGISSPWPKVISPRSRSHCTQQIKRLWNTNAPSGVIWKGFISWICVPNMNFLSLTIQKLWPRLKFWIYIGQMSRPRSLGQNFLHDWKVLIIRNVLMKYESSTPNGSKDMTKVRPKVIRNVGQRSRTSSQGHLTLVSFEMVS